MNPAADELSGLLPERPAEADARARSAFDRAAGATGGRIVIYGAGNLGRRVLQAARNGGLEVSRFADANEALWGESIEGVPIISPREAIRRCAGEALFVVAVWHPARSGGVREILGYLREAGCQAVPFVFLFWIWVPPADTGGKVGVAGNEVWTFKALMPGSSTVYEEYSQPWAGGQKAGWTFKLNVTVK